jgi:hypothetical protein
MPMTVATSKPRALRSARRSSSLLLKMSAPLSVGGPAVWVTVSILGFFYFSLDNSLITSAQIQQVNVIAANWPELAPQTSYWIALLPSAPVKLLGNNLDYVNPAYGVMNGVFWSGAPSPLFPNVNATTQFTCAYSV